VILTEAQAAGVGSATQIAVWAVVLMIVSIVGFWAALWIRKRALGEADSSDEGLTLGALRTMHNRGELTDEEFEAARAAIVSRAGLDPDKARSVKSDGGFTQKAGPGVDLTGAPLPIRREEESNDSESGAN
jgi:hypothetical protein